MSKEAMKLALEALEKMARLTGPQWSLENNYVGHLEALTALREALAEQPAPVVPVQDRNPYAWHYKNTGGASVWHFGPSNKLDADLEAAKKWPRTHQVTPVFTEQRTQQECAELAELGWQAVCCPSCGNAGARGYPRKFTTAPQAQRKPLTLREIGIVCGKFTDEIVKVVRQTEAAHNIKENT